MPQLPAVFEYSIPLPGGRALPVWALGIGAIVAGGLILLRGRGKATAGTPQTVNTSGLQTNQFFEALSRQGVTFQGLLTQQQAQQQAQTASQIAALQAQTTTRLDTLSSQMQTGIGGVSQQVQQTNSNLAKLQAQVKALTLHEDQVNAKQAEVFSRAWAEMGGPVTAVQTAEHFPDPQQYGIGPTGIWITDSQGRVRWQDTSKFGTAIQ